MKFNFTLNVRQQALAEENLLVIDKVISRYIHVDEAVCGLGRDDLYQEGAMALCKAVCAEQRHLPSVPLNAAAPENDRPPPFPEPSVPDHADALIRKLDAASLLADCTRRYTGVARLGVEALELKIRGPDIARLYHTTPNNVGAWISRAEQRLKKDFPGSVEK